MMYRTIEKCVKLKMHVNMVHEEMASGSRI